MKSLIELYEYLALKNFIKINKSALQHFKLWQEYYVRYKVVNKKVFQKVKEKCAKK